MKTRVAPHDQQFEKKLAACAGHIYAGMVFLTVGEIPKMHSVSSSDFNNWTTRSGKLELDLTRTYRSGKLDLIRTYRSAKFDFKIKRNALFTSVKVFQPSREKKYSK